jgi:CDGSH-type Zn-finger protein
MPDTRSSFTIKVLKNGPYILSGVIPLHRKSIVSLNPDDHLTWTDNGSIPQKESYSLCRCGKSENKPFCDGTHYSEDFEGTETAPENPEEKCTEVTYGPSLILYDYADLCAAANFCHRKGDVWNAVEKSDVEEFRNIAIYEASCCPSGRLVLVDNTAGIQVLEPVLEPAVSIIEDTASNTSGPLWVQGKITIEAANGHLYQQRNNATLCRCGFSENKPFCDGMHIDKNFKEFDEKNL